MTCPHLTADQRCTLAEELVRIVTAHERRVPVVDPAGCVACQRENETPTTEQPTVAVASFAAAALADTPALQQQVLTATRELRGGRLPTPDQGPVPPRDGPGRQLQADLKRLWDWPTCSPCADTAARMDRIGPTQCLREIDSLAGEVLRNARELLSASRHWSDRIVRALPDGFTLPLLRGLIRDAASAAAARQPYRLAVVTALFNPRDDARITANWRRWRDSLEPALRSGAVDAVVTAEALWGDQTPHVDPTACDLLITATPDQLLWQKERLLNLAIASLPAIFDAVAWIDSDILFDRPDWPLAVRESLIGYDAVQLFDTAHQLDATGRVAASYPCAVRQPVGMAWPGYAWAAWRRALPHGLYDRDITGTGDLRMLDGWLGRTSAWLQHATPPAQGDDFAAWLSHTPRPAVGFVGGSVRHLYHGPLSERKYHHRQRLLFDAGFDPVRDLEIAENGLWRFTGRNPDLQAAVSQFHSTPVPSQEFAA